MQSQVGIPADRQQYIHRLGRTGRKGKEGQGILLLAPWEEFFLSTIKDLPMTKAPVPLVDPDMTKKVGSLTLPSPSFSWSNPIVLEAYGFELHKYIDALS